MKDTKTGDKNNWKAERIKEGGKMVQSLATLFDRVEEENKMSIKWWETKLIQSTKEEIKKECKKVKEGYF